MRKLLPVTGFISLLALAPLSQAAPAHATSKDGTRIAYEKVGKGSALILIGGALSDRKGGAELARLLAPQFTVYTYDRRGRGDSTDTPPYTLKREIEDLEAVIDAAGGSANVYGKSSGAGLAIHATAALDAKVKKLAIYEAPYSEAEGAAAAWKLFRAKITGLLGNDRREEAVTAFMKFVGTPEAAITKLKASPAWAGMVAMAPTLEYDNDILGDDRVVPVTVAKEIKVPVLIMDGGASVGPVPSMKATADKLGKAIKGSQRKTLEGQDHNASAKALAPVLAAFFK